MRRLALALWALAMLVAATTGVQAIVGRAATFPHEEHEGLFPLCSGCHSGVETGVESEIYPTEQACLNCHDGVIEEVVEWTEPTHQASNLRFSHSGHLDHQRAAGEPWECSSCHGEGSDPDLMVVERASPETCLTCHAHEAPLHLSGGRDCAQCHVILSGAGDLSAEAIAAFPQPADHAEPGFQSAHGAAALEASESCAFCHARESCTRCHANSGALQPIQALARDARVASLVSGMVPEYEEPISHQDADWSDVHGQVALEAADSCANCHTEPSCRQCHTGAGPGAVATLPVVAEGDRRGVQVAIASVHRPGFATEHGTEAATAPMTCEGCHTSDACTDCHNAPGGGFHPANFLQMHGPEAYGVEAECASCHSPEVFCRGCHTDAGMGPSGNLRVAFHSAQPGWLLGHGNAARQGLESCVTCHRQVDCMQCHAAVGSWSINPHGPDFQGERLSGKNTAACNLCHRVGP